MKNALSSYLYKWGSLGGRCICLLSVGAWIAALHPMTTTVDFARRMSPWLEPFQLGVGTYSALHLAQVSVVVLAALTQRRTATNIFASVWALLSTAAGFAVRRRARCQNDLGMSAASLTSGMSTFV